MSNGSPCLWAMLVELSVVEQPYHAVMEVTSSERNDSAALLVAKVRP